jgi:parvulin-like peptidyl-prolyl isomerase
VKSLRYFLLCLLVGTGFLSQSNSTAWGDPGDGVSYAVDIPDVVAKVNGVEIDSRYVKFQLERIIKLNNRPLTGNEKARLLKDIVEKEIVRELVLQEGKSKNRTLPAEILEEEFGKLKASYKSEEEFQSALKDRNISETDLRRSLEIDSLAQMLIGEQIKGRIAITDEETRTFYDQNKERFHRPESYRAQHIFIAPFPPGFLDSIPEGQRDAKRLEMARKADKQLSDILEQIRGGGDFSTLAKEYSHDRASAENGGDLEVVYKGVLPPEFDEEIEKLKPGEISQPFTTSYGHHIVKLNETRPAEYAEFDEMKESIQRHLFTEKAQVEVQKYIDDLRSKAKVELFI